MRRAGQGGDDNTTGLSVSGVPLSPRQVLQAGAKPVEHSQVFVADGAVAPGHGAFRANRGRGGVRRRQLLHSPPAAVSTVRSTPVTPHEKQSAAWSAGGSVTQMMRELRCTGAGLSPVSSEPVSRQRSAVSEGASPPGSVASPKSGLAPLDVDPTGAGEGELVDLLSPFTPAERALTTSPPEQRYVGMAAEQVHVPNMQTSVKVRFVQQREVPPLPPSDVAMTVDSLCMHIIGKQHFIGGLYCQMLVKTIRELPETKPMTLSQLRERLNEFDTKKWPEEIKTLEPRVYAIQKRREKIKQASELVQKIIADLTSLLEPDIVESVRQQLLALGEAAGTEDKLESFKEQLISCIVQAQTAIDKLQEELEIEEDDVQDEDGQDEDEQAPMGLDEVVAEAQKELQGFQEKLVSLNVVEHLAGLVQREEEYKQQLLVLVCQNEPERIAAQQRLVRDGDPQTLDFRKMYHHVQAAPERVMECQLRYEPRVVELQQRLQEPLTEEQCKLKQRISYALKLKVTLCLFRDTVKIAEETLDVAIPFVRFEPKLEKGKVETPFLNEQDVETTLHNCLHAGVESWCRRQELHKTSGMDWHFSEVVGGVGGFSACELQIPYGKLMPLVEAKQAALQQEVDVTLAQQAYGRERRSTWHGSSSAADEVLDGQHRPRP